MKKLILSQCFIACLLSSASAAESFRNPEKSIIKIKDDEKNVYHTTNNETKEFTYGYGINGQQFHHHILDIDGVTYGCYGFIDPRTRSWLIYYISDEKGYRTVTSALSREIKIYPKLVDEDDILEKSKFVLKHWKDLSFPKECRDANEKVQEIKSKGLPEFNRPISSIRKIDNVDQLIVEALDTEGVGEDDENNVIGVILNQHKRFSHHNFLANNHVRYGCYSMLDTIGHKKLVLYVLDDHGYRTVHKHSKLKVHPRGSNASEVVEYLWEQLDFPKECSTVTKNDSSTFSPKVKVKVVSEKPKTESAATRYNIGKEKIKVKSTPKPTIITKAKSTTFEPRPATSTAATKTKLKKITTTETFADNETETETNESLNKSESQKKEEILTRSSDNEIYTVESSSEPKTKIKKITVPTKIVATRKLISRGPSSRVTTAIFNSEDVKTFIDIEKSQPLNVTIKTKKLSNSINNGEHITTERLRIKSSTSKSFQKDLDTIETTTSQPIKRGKIIRVKTFKKISGNFVKEEEIEHTESSDTKTTVLNDIGDKNEETTTESLEKEGFIPTGKVTVSKETNTVSSVKPISRGRPTRPTTTKSSSNINSVESNKEVKTSIDIDKTRSYSRNRTVINQISSDSIEQTTPTKIRLPSNRFTTETVVKNVTKSETLPTDTGRTTLPPTTTSTTEIDDEQTTENYQQNYLEIIENVTHSRNIPIKETTPKETSIITTETPSITSEAKTETPASITITSAASKSASTTTPSTIILTTSTLSKAPITKTTPETITSIKTTTTKTTLETVDEIESSTERIVEKPLKNLFNLTNISKSQPDITPPLELENGVSTASTATLETLQTSQEQSLDATTEIALECNYDDGSCNDNETKTKKPKTLETTTSIKKSLFKSRLQGVIDITTTSTPNKEQSSTEITTTTTQTALGGLFKRKPPPAVKYSSVEELSNPKDESTTKASKPIIIPSIKPSFKLPVKTTATPVRLTTAAFKQPRFISRPTIAKPSIKSFAFKPIKVLLPKIEPRELENSEELNVKSTTISTTEEKSTVAVEGKIISTEIFDKNEANEITTTMSTPAKEEELLTTTAESEDETISKTESINTTTTPATVIVKEEPLPVNRGRGRPRLTVEQTILVRQENTKNTAPTIEPEDEIVSRTEPISTTTTPATVIVKEEPLPINRGRGRPRFTVKQTIPERLESTENTAPTADFEDEIVTTTESISTTTTPATVIVKEEPLPINRSRGRPKFTIEQTSPERLESTENTTPTEKSIQNNSSRRRGGSYKERNTSVAPSPQPVFQTQSRRRARPSNGKVESSIE